MKTLLVIDDEHQIIELVEEFFERENLRVLTADNAEDGFVILKKEVVDIVVCDIRMPGKDGLEALAEFNKISFDIPFIFYSGFATPENRQLAQSLGVNKIIDKTDFKALKEEIHNRIEQAKSA